MKEQIEEIARVICTPTANKGNCEKCGFKKHCSKFDDATDLYNAGYRKQEWISIKDALPEKFDFYLVSIIDHFGLDCVTVLPYSNLFGFGSYEVTHWMPFPEPPKMKGGAE